MSPSSAASSVVSVAILGTPGQLLWTFDGPANVAACTGNECQAAGDLDGDYHNPTAVVASTAHTLTLQYADTFTPDNAAWIVQNLPTGIALNGSTFALPQAGFF